MDINSAMFFTEYCCSSLSRVGSVIPLRVVVGCGRTKVGVETGAACVTLI